jgi:hypothetical protein
MVDSSVHNNKELKMVEVEVDHNEFVKSPSGMEATFIVINGRGLKLFRKYDYVHVTRIRDLQNKAFELNLGPEAFEIVETWPTETYTRNGVLRVERIGHFNREQEEESVNLINSLRENDFPSRVYDDLYECNIGFKEINGVRTMVCIDFGTLS